MSDSSDYSSSPRRSTRSSPRRRQQLQQQHSQSSQRSSSPPPSDHNIPSSPVAHDVTTSSAPQTPHQISSPLPYASTPGSVISQQSPTAFSSPRRDLGYSRTSREVTEPSSTGDSQRHSTSEASGTLARTVIWGTDVNVGETSSKFKKFLMEFKDEYNVDVPKYVSLIKQMAIRGTWHLDLDCSDLREYNNDLYTQMMRYPQEVIHVFDRDLEAVFKRLTGEDADEAPQIRPFNLEHDIAMRSLNPENVDQLVSVRGMVIRISPIIPDARAGYFQCTVCNNGVTVMIERGRITEPVSCNNCSTQKSFQLVHNRCEFANKQMIKLQETPDIIPEGQTPQTVLAFAYDTLVDTVQPGDMVEITGIYRATPLRLNPRQRSVKSVFKTHIDVLHFRERQRYRIDKDDLPDDEMLSEEVLNKRNEQLIKLSQEPDIVDRLVAAVAPNIFGFENVKRGVLAMLFGGTHKTFKESARGRFRGEINILLCGDPGTSKSQILQYAVKLAPRGMYTSGKGSSAVGLTAYVTRDPETRQIVLESGALVLCDGGICCIDEFDKMSDSTRSILHEVMEQQTVSIAKAGIIASLNARTSILAAANPQESVWNKRLSIVENIQLPPTLLSRFDLIYLILDTPNKVKDRNLAKHIVSLYYENREQVEDTSIMNRKILSDYISYARKITKPVLQQAASTELINAYLKLRKDGNKRHTVTATPRQLESLIRLSEAHAKMRFSNEVEVLDVEFAVNLMKEALLQAATDSTTGLIDMDIITTGLSASKRHIKNDLTKAILDTFEQRHIVTAKFSEFCQIMNEQSSVSVSNKQIQDSLATLEVEEQIKITNRSKSDFMFRVLRQDDA
eukprot:m.2675 g.2675  ORF g.2675 m.2675 type:complete len:846 (-) comp1883_c0_seq1:42-2579(-)